MNFAKNSIYVFFFKLIYNNDVEMWTVTDPNVDVVYISPVPVNDEMLQYYAKLLGLKAAIDSGNVEDQADVSDRYRIITPEAINSFPVSPHFFCLLLSSSIFFLHLLLLSSSFLSSSIFFLHLLLLSSSSVFFCLSSVFLHLLRLCFCSSFGGRQIVHPNY